MSDVSSFVRLRRAVQQHLRGFDGLRGCLIAIRDKNGTWSEATLMGQVDNSHVEPAVASFAADEGGKVVPLDEGQWLATYPVHSSGMDFLAFFFLGGFEGSNLASKLAALESKTGWLVVAALSDLDARQMDATLSTEVGAQILLDAARARTRQELADQWIARLEKAFQPSLIGVVWADVTQTKLGAISGGNLIERKSRTASLLERYADEAVKARTSVLTDISDDALASVAKQDGPEEVLTALDAKNGLAIPVYEGDECRAVVVGLWNDDSPGSPPSADWADIIGQVLGEAMMIQARARPSLLRRATNWLAGWMRAIFGKRALKLKIALVVIAVTLTALEFVPSRFRPSFDARIEAQDRRIISAPYDGFLVSAPLQLGDAVTPGDLLIAMEVTDQRLQLARTDAELRRLDSEIQTARAKRDTATLQTLDAQKAQVEVQRELLSQQIGLARRLAEAEGVVVSGDSWRREGGRVRLGEPLLELASVDEFRVLAFVDEAWVSEIPEQTVGSLLLAAYPEHPLDVSVEVVTNEVQNREGTNTFLAWLIVTPRDEVELLDGMRGIARLDLEETTMLRAYTRGPVLWFKRLFWRWS